MEVYTVQCDGHVYDIDTYILILTYAQQQFHARTTKFMQANWLCNNNLLTITPTGIVKYQSWFVNNPCDMYTIYQTSL